MFNKNKNVIVFGLNEAAKLTNLICKNLGIENSQILIKKFADGEIFCRPNCSVRNKKVIIIQSTSKPVNDNLMTLLIAIDALKRASAKEINVIIPYFGYARQDRKSHGREPITAKLVADLLTVAGATKVTVMDIHSSQIQGFFNVPVDTLRATYILVKALKNEYAFDDLCIVSPDYGGVKRAREISEILNVPLAIVIKRRPKHNEVTVESILGNVKNKTCVIVDDMIDTGQTIIKAAKLLKKIGAVKIIILATHGLFNNNAVNDFTTAYQDGIIEAVYVTNTIESVYHKQFPSLRIVSLDEFFTEVLKIYIKDDGSISEVYNKYRCKVTDVNEN